MSLSQSYTIKDVIRWYEPGEIQKAKAYLNSIGHLEVRPDKIVAEVKGTAAHPYQVEISFSVGKVGELHIEPTCNCPVRWKCKHSAAVLLSALALPRPPAVNHAVLEWIESFRRTARAQPKKTAKSAPRPEKLCYALTRSTYTGDYIFGTYKGKLDAEGRLAGRLEEWSNVERALLKPPQFVTEEDLPILRLLWQQRDRYGYFPVKGVRGNEIMASLLASGRLFFIGQVAGNRYLKSEPVHLRQGRVRKAQLEWGVDDAGRMAPRIVSGAALEVFPFSEATWYVDVASGEAGQLQTVQTPAQVAQLLEMPPLAEIDVPVVSEVLRELVPDLPPPSAGRLRTLKSPLTPMLLLDTSEPLWMGSFRGYRYGTRELDFARVRFRYGEAILPLGHPGEFATLQNGETVRVMRDSKAEKRFLNTLGAYGLEEMPGFGLSGNIGERPVFVLENEKAWPSFMQEMIPRLHKAGWEVIIPQGFRHHVLEVEAWEAEFGEREDGWFSLNMGIVVNGRRLPLAPLLHELFRVDPRWLDAIRLERMDDDEPIELLLEEGGKVLAPAGRIKPLARTLIELFEGGRSGDEIRLSRYDVARIGDLTGMERWQFKGAAAVTGLADKLRNAAGIKPVAAPQGFALQLRPYQLEGLSWLQYLREQELAGILADDMGLGKTAQALAHLLLEKQSGRMDKPSLVVLPTSLIFNWKREAERFAPQLKLLSLHGKERAEHFPAIPEHDVILTTYPLLWRDEEALAEHAYHLLILDEAQTVKNVSSQAAQVVRKLNARHRLCLTGTPLENHLGELWAQFDFLLPGLLGTSKEFTRIWRNPIEKQGNTQRRDLLARRVRPFILRRRKEDVAQELPAKTLIVRSVELEGAQRDLYEAVRIAMDQRVREEIAAKGLSRSHIVILDALLKLRQVCCDPRLLKLASAKKVKERAKLDLLMEMLPELVSEGRRILVFSQFTSMLELIEAELTREKLDYVKLTGDTQNREEVVRRFQDEEVPVFLISLKAGGVGLNLTAADTVIHYDPWWNPAVENQATDRAHRLGQTKNVFVYKLVVAGSIEEKILALQEKKAELAAGILSEDVNSLAKFGEADIAALLAPLPEDEETAKDLAQ
ncbi:SNF2-related protein [Candidatus Ferrigenium straubiae]|jgi:superfamily II DNA or RNA helicase|uniref:SNF2-related protein n=1 Tax=Candidatus Ferrigenium straubiae TaxID=2919506 RepID=UPI003F4A9D5E